MHAVERQGGSASYVEADLSTLSAVDGLAEAVLALHDHLDA
jgi:hypothetical protein